MAFLGEASTTKEIVAAYHTNIAVVITVKFFTGSKAITIAKIVVKFEFRSVLSPHLQAFLRVTVT